MQLVFNKMDTPVGVLKIGGSRSCIGRGNVDNEDHKRVRLASLVRQDDHSISLKTQQQPKEYL